MNAAAVRASQSPDPGLPQQIIMIGWVTILASLDTALIESAGSVTCREIYLASRTQWLG